MFIDEKLHGIVRVYISLSAFADIIKLYGVVADLAHIFSVQVFRFVHIL